MSKPAILKAVKEKCIDCCCGQINEVRLCPSTNCPIYPYRNGKDTLQPKREMTEAQKRNLAEMRSKLLKNREIPE